MALPLGKLLIGPGVRCVFAPQQRRRTTTSNAPPPNWCCGPRADRQRRRPHRARRHSSPAQAPHYGAIQTPTTIITGDIDNTVSQHIHAKAIAAMLPRGRLIVLPGIGHMLHHAAADIVIEAIDELSGTK